MWRALFFTLAALLYVVIVLEGTAIVAIGERVVEGPWVVDENGIARVARHPLRRNQAVRASDLVAPPSLPALLGKYVAPVPDSKYLCCRREAGQVVIAGDLSDQPSLAPKPKHTYVSLPIDPFTAAKVMPRDRIEFRDGTKTVFSSCVEAVLPQKVIFAVPDESLDKVPARQQRIVYVIGGPPCR